MCIVISYKHFVKKTSGLKTSSMLFECFKTLYYNLSLFLLTLKQEENKKHLSGKNNFPHAKHTWESLLFGQMYQKYIFNRPTRNMILFLVVLLILQVYVFFLLKNATMSATANAFKISRYATETQIVQTALMKSNAMLAMHKTTSGNS